MFGQRRSCLFGLDDVVESTNWIDFIIPEDVAAVGGSAGQS